MGKFVCGIFGDASDAINFRITPRLFFGGQIQLV